MLHSPNENFTLFMFDQNRYNCYKIQGSLIACCFIPNHIDILSVVLEVVDFEMFTNFGINEHVHRKRSLAVLNIYNVERLTSCRYFEHLNQSLNTVLFKVYWCLVYTRACQVNTHERRVN